jgi:hypothetical protein
MATKSKLTNDAGLARVLHKRQQRKSDQGNTCGSSRPAHEHAVQSLHQALQQRQQQPRHSKVTLPVQLTQLTLGVTSHGHGMSMASWIMV